MARVANTYPEAEDLHVEQASFFTEDKAATKGLTAFMHKAVGAMGEALAKRKADMAKTLNKKGWVSGLARFENIVKDAAELRLSEKVEYATDPSASLWLCEPLALRFSCDAWRWARECDHGYWRRSQRVGLRGLPDARVGHRSERHPVLLGHSLRAALRQGSQHGRRHPRCACAVRPGGLRPHGFLCCYAGGGGGAVVRLCVVLDGLGVALATPLDSATITTIEKFTMSYMETVAADKRFGPRADLFTRYFAAVRDGNNT